MTRVRAKRELDTQRATKLLDTMHRDIVLRFLVSGGDAPSVWSGRF